MQCPMKKPENHEILKRVATLSSFLKIDLIKDGFKHHHDI